jgi:predicted RNase H-like HicB family nuclease
MKDYHINIFFSDEDGGYIADIPDLEACSAFGATPEEALNEVQIAKAAWIEAARAERKPVPKPRYRPAIYQIASADVILNEFLQLGQRYALLDDDHARFVVRYKDALKEEIDYQLKDQRGEVDDGQELLDGTSGT